VVLEPRPFLLGDILRHFMHLYHGTVVHISTKNDIQKSVSAVSRSFTSNFKRFQTALSALKHQKWLKNMRFLPQKIAKKLRFCSFLVKK